MIPLCFRTFEVLWVVCVDFSLHRFWWSFESIWNCFFFFFPVHGNVLLASSWHLVLASLLFSLITEFFSPTNMFTFIKLFFSSLPFPRSDAYFCFWKTQLLFCLKILSRIISKCSSLISSNFCGVKYCWFFFFFFIWGFLSLCYNFTPNVSGSLVVGSVSWMNRYFSVPPTMSFASCEF